MMRIKMNRILPQSRPAFAILLAIGSASDFGAASDAPGPDRPTLPAIRSLAIEPATLTLQDGRDARSVIVWGVTESGEKIDLSWDAKLEASGGHVAVAADGYIEPRSAGAEKIRVRAGGQETLLPVAVTSARQEPVRFVREVQPILSKIGCNAGTCHGSAKGKNGFKLSLRGYDTDADYQALVDDLSGRRFNRVAPDESLMLMKPSGRVAHEGGQVLKPDTHYYAMIRRWIAEGLKPESIEEGRVKTLEVLPAEAELSLPGLTQRFLILAHYADGATRDVTREAVVTSSNTDVGKLDGSVLSAIRRGEGAVLVRYEGAYATAPFTVMGDRTGFEWAGADKLNFIDEHVEAKLKKLKILPAEICSDAEFIRRASLDLTGMPPAPDKARAFANDPAPSREKRERLVDELIGSPAYIEHWTGKWTDLLQCNSESLGEKGVWHYRDWIRRSISDNIPYNEFIRQILDAKGSTYKNPAANYYRVLQEPNKITEDVSQTFLGVRFNCAKCHDHPFEQWTQNQYYQFGAYFARIGIKGGQLPGEQVVYRRSDGGEVMHPKTNKAVEPQVPFGAVGEGHKDAARVDQFVSWLASAENPLFAKAITNRVWSYFFGRGIIEPVDDIRASNPPSNPALLAALTEDFIKQGFDLRKLMRTICLSRTYQASIITTKWNEDDVANFSHALPRRLSAEQMMDSIAVATGHRPKFAGMPAGMRAVEIPDGNVPGDEFLSLFGRPERKSSCECERTSNISLSHALNLVNGSTIDDAINAPGNRIANLVQKEGDDKKVVEEIFYAVLSRAPTEKELETISLAQAPSRLEGAQDLAWALMNSPAFLFNR